jgi:hypothetical protein
VPRLAVSARMSSAISYSLRCRGPTVAASTTTPSGVQAIEPGVQSGPGAGCVSRYLQLWHQVPRSRARPGRRRRGYPRPFVSSGLANTLGGVCRCGLGKAQKVAHSQPGTSFLVAAGARVRCAQKLSQLSQPLTHGSLTTRLSGPGLPSPRARIGRARQYEAPSARLRRRVPAAQRER